MALFEFGNWFSRAKEETPPALHFGRFSDRYKTEEQYAAWYSCLDKFEEGDYFGAYHDFFRYLLAEGQDNVHFSREGEEGFSFKLFQGSQCVQGGADSRKFRASAKVARVERLHLGFMRRLLEKNFNLRYSRFALDEEGDISIVFDSFLLDGAPQKLYHALKELSMQADKMDDLLEQEFPGVYRVRYEHVQPLADDLKKIKYRYFKDTLRHALRQVDEGGLDARTYPQAASYLLLDAVYKLDYLTKPEGYMMDVFERVNRDYFTEDSSQSLHQRNLSFRKELEHLMQRDKEDLFGEMYDTVSTFGMTQVVGHDRLLGFIGEAMREYDWYAENGYGAYCLAIAGYIVGYSLFAWAPPLPDKELLHLYYEIMEGGYFRKLGFQENRYYDAEKQRFNRSAIRKAVQSIVQKNKADFDRISVDTTLLDYTDKQRFAQSYLLMIRNMVLEEK